MLYPIQQLLKSILYFMVSTIVKLTHYVLSYSTMRVFATQWMKTFNHEVLTFIIHAY